MCLGTMKSFLNPNAKLLAELLYVAWRCSSVMICCARPCRDMQTDDMHHIIDNSAEVTLYADPLAGDN